MPNDRPAAEWDVHVEAPTYILVKADANTIPLTLFSTVFLCGACVGVLLLEVLHEIAGSGLGTQRFYTSLGLTLATVGYSCAKLRGTVVHEITE